MCSSIEIGDSMIYIFLFLILLIIDQYSKFIVDRTLSIIGIVSPTQIRRFRLKKGDKILGLTRESKESEKFSPLI